MKIITLTLNPAFDVHCKADGFVPYHESVVEITSREAGGKGVNISRALNAVERENLALVVVGNENGDEFLKMLAADSLVCAPIVEKGRIRENITLHEEHNPETRISFGGFVPGSDILEKIENAMGEIDENTVITLTGSNPKGIKAADVLEMLSSAKSRGAKIVIDSRSLTLAEITAFGPWLIKPNKDEMEKYVGKKINTVGDAARIAEALSRAGIENVMVSLGGDGAVLATREGSFYAAVPPISAVSTIGAGDSSIAGFIDAYCGGKAPDECLRRAVSFGTAACMREGTKPPLREDITAIESKVNIKRIV